MVKRHRAPRQGRDLRTDGRYRFGLLVLTALFVSVGAIMESARLRLPGAAQAQGTTVAQGITLEPIPADAVVVGTTHALTFQLTDANDQPVQEAGLEVQVAIIEYPSPHPRQVDPLLASVAPL